MIKIRYRDLGAISPGLHAAAERHGRSTTVYLTCGLTVPQRRAALRRLRLSARMGHCPRLPAGQLALALLADRIRTGLVRVGTVFRLHPAGSAVPVMMASGAAIVFLVLCTVPCRVLPGPRLPGEPPALAAPGGARATPAAGPSPAPGPGARPDDPDVWRLTGARSSAPGTAAPGASSGPGTGGTGGTGGTAGTGGTGGTGSAGSAGGDGSPDGSGSAPPGGTAGATPAASTPSPAQPGPPSQAPTTPAARPSPSPSGICLGIAPVSVCLGG
jgi:hypothetical protein